MSAAAGRTLVERYARVLDAHLAGEGEAALAGAYELGRAALAAGHGVLDVVTIHHEAVEARLACEPAPASRALVAAARAVLLETLSPFEMTHRGFREGNAALRRLNEALEQQARRIARALHDETAQLVTALAVALAGLEREAAGVPRARLDEMRALLGKIGEELRAFSHELRPPLLDELGLVPALEHHARGVSALKGLDIEVVAAAPAQRWPAPVETALYRVVQEALANVARHARARRVTVRVDSDARTVRCVVVDDGQGFEPAALVQRGDHGLGLIGMRERLGALGGSLEIESTPGAGTKLTATVFVGGSHARQGAARG